ncbi:MAG: outer membrane protein assembly factor BamB [Betaproteobacteria bacterium]|nr:outer membrane protein assembly factor BamB [Betaproteobacteria bacterium]
MIHMSVRRVLAMAAITLLTACASDAPIKPNKLSKIEERAKVKTLWTYDVRAARPYDLQPASVEGDVFTADAKGRLVRLNGQSGKEKWRLDTKEPISGGIGVGAGLLVVGTAKGKVMAFDLDGRPRWSAYVSSAVLAPPAADGAWVVVRTGDGWLYGLSATDGARKWEFQMTLPSLSLRSSRGVVLDGEYVFAGLPAGKLVALRLADGVQLWEATVAPPRGENEIERIADVAAPPMRQGDYACAVNFQGRVGCYDLLKGAGVWSREGSSAQPLAGDDRAVYVAGDTSVLFAHDRETGALIWKQDKLFGRRLGPPLLLGEYLVVADFQGYVHLVNRSDGALAGRTRADGDAIRAAPLRVGDAVVVQSVDGDLRALTLQ